MNKQESKSIKVLSSLPLIKVVSPEEYFKLNSGKDFSEAVKSLRSRASNKTSITEDFEKLRGITIKSDQQNHNPFTYEPNLLKTLYLETDISSRLLDHRMKIISQVEEALEEYFSFKYNISVEDIMRVAKNVNNFKLKKRFEKVVSLANCETSYYDGEYCFLTLKEDPFRGSFIEKCWLKG